MTIYQISIEGQTIPVPENIGKDDKMVKAALAPAFPEVANAAITRTEKDGVCTVTVIKKAGSKGSVSADYLTACPGGRNPVVDFYGELQQIDGEFDALRLLELEHRTGEVLKEGEAQFDAVQHARDRLANAAAQPAPYVVMGF
jgi:hypothetical protein